VKDVVWLSTNEGTPGAGYWDQQLLVDMFVNKMNHTSIGKLKEAIVVVPTAYQEPALVNKELAKLDKCIVICTSDEENKFDLTELKHPNMKLYATYVHKTKADVTWLPIGYTPHSKTKGWKVKDLDIYFAGQVNHDYRQKMFLELSDSASFVAEVSKGFAQGLEPATYIERLQRSKVVPAPRGNISPDSFRLYESLEHGALPVAEDPAFFRQIFGDYPFPVIDVAKQWRGYCEDGLELFPQSQNTSSAWWHRYKETLYRQFNEADQLTVVIPISPIKSHPDTRVLDETIKSIRHHLDCRIILCFDGVRDEQDDRREDYNLFINNVLASGHERIFPIIFDEHMHQSGMMKEILQYIDTDNILYVEQDTPLVTDMPIEFDKIYSLLESESSLVRLHFEAVIPEPHRHLMLDAEPVDGFIRTVQWSQRPHIATTAFYKRIMDEYFTDKSKSFIEDNMHGVVQRAFNEYGTKGWNQFRMHIYAPEGSYKRSLHTDGREGEPKWDDTQVF